jgi:hypothetical protein
VVIDQFNITSISFLETEDNAPVRPNSYPIEPFPVPFQRMDLEARQIHVMRACRTIKNRKDVFYLLNMVRANPFGLTIFEQPLQAFVFKILYTYPSYDG